jgi:hypothetical protein
LDSRPGSDLLLLKLRQVHQGKVTNKPALFHHHLDETSYGGALGTLVQKEDKFVLHGSLLISLIEASSSGNEAISL